MKAACWLIIIGGLFVFFRSGVVVKVSVGVICFVLFLVASALNPYATRRQSAALGPLITYLSTSSWRDQSFAAVVRPAMTDGQMRDLISPRWNDCSMAEMTPGDFEQWFEHMRTTTAPPLIPLTAQGPFLRQVRNGLWLAVARLEDPQAVATAAVESVWTKPWVRKTQSNMGPLERLISQLIHRAVAYLVNRHRRATGRVGANQSYALAIPDDRFFRIFVGPAGIGLLSMRLPIRRVWTAPREHLQLMTLEGHSKKRIVLRFTDGSRASFFVRSGQRTQAKLVVDGFLSLTSV